MIGNPESASIFLPSCSFVPFMRTTSGTFNCSRPRRSDHTLGDHVAAHDAAENVDQNGFQVRVAKHQLERLGHFLRRRAAADVQKIGRLAVEQLDRVHRRHRKTGAVYQTADVAVELYVRQIELGCFDLGRIFFVEVAQCDDVRVPKQCIRIEVHLRIEHDQLAVAGQHQRIDFRQRRIGFPERFVECLENCARSRNAGGWYADLERDVIGVALAQPERLLDVHLVNLLRRMCGHFLDVDPTLRACNQRDLLRRAIDDHADIELLLDIGAVFDQQPANFLSARTRLVCDQLHAENFRGARADFFDRARNLDTASLAATARMNLRLDDPHRSAQVACRIDRFFDAEYRPCCAAPASRSGERFPCLDTRGSSSLDASVGRTAQPPDRRSAMHGSDRVATV